MSQLAAVYCFVQSSWPESLFENYPTISLLAGWTLGMLSYHQDAKRHDAGWAVWSQIFAVVCLIAVVVFGFAHRSWLNLVIAVPLIWLHVQFTRRWWARPGAWW